MKLARSGVVISHPELQVVKHSVVVLCGSDKLLIPLEKSNLPSIGAKVVVFFDEINQRWKLAA